MQGIIDIHNHILFDIDDGAKSIGESIEMIKKEYEQGVRKIILTPHYYQGYYTYDKEQYDIRYRELSDKVRGIYPDFELYKGQEILYTNDIKTLLQNDGIQRMADSKYVLIEFMIDIAYSELEKSVKEVLMEGCVPIIAHCERYKCLWKSISKIRHIVESGAYIQVNAATVTSFSGKGFVRQLIDEDLIHFIATDAHNLSGRTVNMAKCVDYLLKRYNEEYVRWLLIENPQKVIDDEYI